MRPRWLAGLGERARALFAPAHFEAELDEEIRYHIEAATERNLLRGMTPEAARAAALGTFGSIGEAKEQVRIASGVRPIQHLLQDQMHAVKAVRRQPRSALMVVVTVATCIGAWGGATVVLDAVLLEPPPFSEPDRVVSIFNQYAGSGLSRAGNAVPDYYDRRRLVASLDDVALYTRTTYALSGIGGGERVRALSATPSLLSVLKVEPALGHDFTAHLPDTARSREVLISHRLWESLFHGSAGVLGQEVTLEGEPFSVIGVLPASFRFSEWDPLVLTRLSFPPRQVSEAGRHRDFYDMVGRLAPGATAESAAAEIALLNRARLARYPAELRVEMTRAGFHTEVVPYVSDLTREVRTPLWSIALGALVLLLVGTASGIGAFLRRTESRTESGEGWQRFRRRILSESTWLCFAGGVAGLAVAAWSLLLFTSASEGVVPRLEGLRMAGWVIGVCLTIGVAIGMGAGVASVASPQRRSPRRLPSRLLMGQITLSVALALGAVVATVDATGKSQVETGFEASGLITATISLPDSRYPDESRRLAFTTRMISTLESLPGVASVTIADQPPFSGGAQPVPITTGVPRPDGSASGIMNQTIVSESYFETLSIDLVEGRSFLASDDHERTRVAMVDEVFARRYWPDGDVIGQSFWRGGPGDPLPREKAMTVVGVVKPVRQNDLTAESTGAFYVPVAQSPLGYFRLMIRLGGEAEGEWQRIQAAIASLDPDLVVTPPVSVQEAVTASLGIERLTSRWLSALALLGLGLGLLGVWPSAIARSPF